MQVLFPENGGNGPESASGIEEIDGWRADSDVEAYIANRSVSDEYRDAERAIACDPFKTFAKTNLVRLENGKRRDQYMVLKVG